MANDNTLNAHQKAVLVAWYEWDDLRYDFFLAYKQHLPLLQAFAVAMHSESEWGIT